ncbi:hypothetical protein, partial [Bacteroides stercoris]|uniref:hypothetical protein n=1 Tax=Bacteroides stercoris TaxID=46506 RepID=UPI00233F0F82
MKKGRQDRIAETLTYKDYFLMVDEIDVLQTDNNFRPQLENVIDYYFMFPEECAARGARVILVSGPVQLRTHYPVYR